MQELTLRKAKLSDLDSIMNIEENGFIPEIQEEGQVFEARINACPELFLIFEAASYSCTTNSGEASNTNGTANYSGAGDSSVAENCNHGAANCCEASDTNSTQNSSDSANTNLADNTNCTDNTNNETEVCDDAHNTNNATTNSMHTPAGYLCAELMSRIPETAQDVALGHTPEGTAAVEDECTPLETPAQPLTAVSHLAATAQPLTAVPHSVATVQPLTAAQPSILYISSFSLLPQFRGNGNGTQAWQLAMTYFEKHFPHMSAYVLLVNRDWSGAAHIYTKSGFKEYKVLKDFFPRQDNSHSDGILMIKSISPENS